MMSPITINTIERRNMVMQIKTFEVSYRLNGTLVREIIMAESTFRVNQLLVAKYGRNNVHGIVIKEIK